MTEYRAFKARFVRYLAQSRGGWPEVTALCRALRDRGYPAKRDWLAALRADRPAPLCYTSGLIEVLLTSNDREFAQGKRALVAFLSEHGFVGVGIDQLEVILSQVCDVPTHDLPDDDSGRSGFDFFLRPFASVAKAAVDYGYRYGLVNRATQADIDEAVRWMYIDIGRSRTSDGQLASDPECLRRGEELFREAIPVLVEKACAWHEFNPWTVVRAMKGTKPYGVSIVLPVTEAVYSEMRAGQRPLSDVAPSEMLVPSNHLVFLILAENPHVLRLGKDPTKILRAAVVAQHGALMRLGSPGLGLRYWSIAAEGTGENRDRMADAGYRALPASDPRTGCRLWESSPNFDAGGEADIEFEVALRRLARLAPSAPRLF